MALTLQFGITYASVPFLTDDSRAVRLRVPGEAPERSLLKQQPEESMLDDIDRTFPFEWSQEFGYDEAVPQRNLSALARIIGQQHVPGPKIQIGELYYPSNAQRWSYYRGLATSSAVKAMGQATNGGKDPATFVLKSTPEQGAKAGRTYGISTPMFMLPPRPLGELAGRFDGLYLVTLVDERYHWQYAASSLRVTHGTTWDLLITTLAADLNATITYSTIPPEYGQPEPDSQLWTNYDRSAVLLDAVAFCLGRSVSRDYDGTYHLYTSEESATLAASSRRDSQGKVLRLNGGDVFNSGTALPAGSLLNNRQSIVPSAVRMTFPKYVIGNDPVPHYVNSRQQATRQYEDSYGDTYPVDVPIASGGPLTSGLTGVGTHVIQSTAKALYSGDNQAFGSTPLNNSGLTALAVEVAGNHWFSLIGTGLDEAYLGVLAWTPDGLHDVVFTASAKSRIASTRVMRQEWNAFPREMQHGTPYLSGTSVSPVGQGGPPPTLTVRDTATPSYNDTLADPCSSGDNFISLNTPPSIAQSGQIKVLVEGERMIVRTRSGTSFCDISARGIDGTQIADHPPNARVSGLAPNVSYLTNVLTFEDPLRVSLGAFTSGGVQEARVQIRSGAISSGTSISFDSGVTNNFYSTNNFYNQNTFFGITNLSQININQLNYNFLNVTLIAGTYNNYPTSGYSKFRISAASGTVIAGFVAAATGQILYLWNAGTGAFTLQNQAAGASSPDRITTPIGVDYTLWPNDGCIIEYDGTTWRFDVPTLAGGVTTGAGGSGLLYSLRDLRVGSGLTFTTIGDGAAVLTAGAAASPPVAKVKGLGTLVSGNNKVVMRLSSVIYDTGGFFGVSGSTKLIVGVPGGVFHVGGQIQWEAGKINGTFREAEIWVNGVSGELFTTIPNPPVTSVIPFHTIAGGDLLLNSGDYIELYGRQDALGLMDGETVLPELWIHRVGSLP